MSIDWDCHDWLKRVAFGTLRKMGYTYLAYHTLSESWGTLSRQDKFIEKEKITFNYTLTKLKINFFSKHQNKRIYKDLLLKPFISLEGILGQ